MMGVRPFATAARTFLLTVSSVSAKYWRRSEWPSTTYCAPTALSMSAEISPVKAPLFSQCMFCAPTLMLLPLAAAATATRSTNGTQTTTSHWASATLDLSASTSSAPSQGSLFIFQLPAMMGFLILFTSVNG